jgi:hypothetical protein
MTYTHQSFGYRICYKICFAVLSDSNDHAGVGVALTSILAGTLEKSPTESKPLLAFRPTAVRLTSSCHDFRVDCDDISMHYSRIRRLFMRGKGAQVRECTFCLPVSPTNPEYRLHKRSLL